MKDEIAMVPFVAHESAMNRMERANKRLWITNIVLISTILLIVGGFITYLLIPNEIIQEGASQEVSEITNSQINQSIGE